MRTILVGFMAILAGCGTPPPVAEKQAPPPPKITQFYSATTVVPKGDSVTLCYGTENADSLKLEPYTEEVRPALTRCIADTPQKDTTYTLTAKGPGGETSATFSVRIGPKQARDNAGNRVLIKSFNYLGGPALRAGESAMLCYTTDGAQSVSIQPPAGVATPGGGGYCYNAKVSKTTTFLLTATAADGAVDRMQVTVPVQ